MVSWEAQQTEKLTTWALCFIYCSRCTGIIFADLKNKMPRIIFIWLKQKLYFCSQTTLSVDDTKNIIQILKKNFPNIKDPIKEDICYATTNRQLAVKKIAPLCDIIFVIGSKNSSNSLRLVEVAKKSGCKNTLLVDSKNESKINDILKNVKLDDILKKTFYNIKVG